MWENNARVMVDYTCGAGMAARAALLMGVKCVLVAHNAFHASVVRRPMIEFISRCAKAKNRCVSPPDAESRLAAAKPARLVAWLSQKGNNKRVANETSLGDREKGTKRSPEGFEDSPLGLI